MSIDAPPFLQKLFEEAETMVFKFEYSISAFPLHVYYTALTDMQADSILYEKYACEFDITESKILERLRIVEAAVTQGKQ